MPFHTLPDDCILYSSSLSNQISWSAEWCSSRCVFLIRSNMKALAHFTVSVEEPPCLALPFHSIRQHINKSDSILLEGDDGENYKARLFRRSKSSNNIYVAEGWSRFERAHGIGEGDILFCKLLEGPKLKISVAEKSGRQNAQHTDSGSSNKQIYMKKKTQDQGARGQNKDPIDFDSSIKQMYKKRKIEEDADSGPHFESSVLKKKRKGNIPEASTKIERQSKLNSRGQNEGHAGSESGSSIKQIDKKRQAFFPKSVLLPESGLESRSFSILEKREDIPEARFSRKNVVTDLDSEPHDSQISMLEKGKEIARSCILKQQCQSLSKKKADRFSEPQSSEKNQVLARIHALTSKICNPHHILEITNSRMHQKAAVPKEFAVQVNAVNGNFVKLMVSEGSYRKVKWINVARFKGFGKGWFPFLNRHGLRLGDYMVLELIGEKEIAVHFFYLAPQSADKKKNQKIKEEHGSKADESPKQEKHEQMSFLYKPTSKAQSRKHEQMNPVKHEERSFSCKPEPCCTCSISDSELEEQPFRPRAKYSRYCNFS